MIHLEEDPEDPEQAKSINETLYTVLLTAPAEKARAPRSSSSELFRLVFCTLLLTYGGLVSDTALCSWFGKICIYVWPTTKCLDLEV